jgi:hypothetical protein
MLYSIFRGITAGFIATVVLSVLMLSRDFVPQLDSITMLDGVLRATLRELGMLYPPAPWGGWMWHFIIGTFWWGAMFAILEPILPGQRPWRKGMAFGFGASLLIFLLVMPLAGAGYFGMHLSAVQPVVTMIEHLVYGAVLGITYTRLESLFPAAT